MVLPFSEVTFTAGFLVVVVLVLALDLGLFTKTNKPVSFAQAGVWSAVWVAMALGFFFLLRYQGHLVHGVHSMQVLKSMVDAYAPTFPWDDSKDFETLRAAYDRHLSLEFITGYLVEYALSVDNVFVIILIFSSFKVRQAWYKKVLFWGILGAIVMRFAFISLGATLLQRFDWVLYIFGAFLLITGVRMFFQQGEEEESIDTANHPVVRVAGRLLPVFPRYVGGRFWLVQRGKFWFTPLFVVLLIIEFTDLLFAVDSVPAVFSVTKDPQIVFYSNIFAILGLRSMFFFLSNIMHIFHYLKLGLAVLLCYIGLKMLAHHWLMQWGFTNVHSLLIIVGILATAIVASLVFPQKVAERA